MLAREKYLGIAIMCIADLARYSKLIKDLKNDFTKINDNYPKDMTETLFVLMNYKRTHRKKTTQIHNYSEGTEFTQDGRIAPN